MQVWRAAATIEKYRASDIASAGLAEPSRDEMVALGIMPYEVARFEENVLVNAGITLLLNLLIGGGGTTYAHNNGRLGIGDGNGSVPTAAATDTGLAATANKYYQACDAAFPTVAGTTAIFQATFPTTQANFAWNEFLIDNGGASSAVAAGTALNHKGQSFGTKTSSSAWAFNVSVTIS